MDILIVDDSPINTALLIKVLQAAGYTNCFEAHSAMETFDLLGMARGSEKKIDPDLILMDVMMPEIDGIEATRQIKSFESYQDVPIIIVTARTDMECLENAFYAGALDYLTKPIRKVEIVARVGAALKLKKAIDQRKQHAQELMHKNAELQKAIDEIETLRGFLPICASCKKIRNSEGYWQQVESYLQQRSNLKFSHGICEDCMAQIYPEIAQRRKNHEK